MHFINIQITFVKYYVETEQYNKTILNTIGFVFKLFAAELIIFKCNYYI